MGDGNLRKNSWLHQPVVWSSSSQISEKLAGICQASFALCHGLDWSSLQCSRLCLHSLHRLHCAFQQSCSTKASITGKHNIPGGHGPLHSNGSSGNSSSKISYDHCKKHMFERLIKLKELKHGNTAAVQHRRDEGLLPVLCHSLHPDQKEEDKDKRQHLKMLSCPMWVHSPCQKAPVESCCEIQCRQKLMPGKGVYFLSALIYKRLTWILFLSGLFAAQRRPGCLPSNTKFLNNLL